MGGMDKTCTKCNLPQPTTEFSKHPNGKGGLQPVCKTCNRARCQVWRNELKHQVFDYFGAKCACCGETEFLFLTLDHKHNDGAEHRRQLARGRSGRTASPDTVYRELVKTNFADADRFQVLCYNCNCAKRGNGGVCPHQEGDK